MVGAWRAWNSARDAGHIKVRYHSAGRVCTSNRDAELGKTSKFPPAISQINSACCKTGPVLLLKDIHNDHAEQPYFVGTA